MSSSYFQQHQWISAHSPMIRCTTYAMRELPYLLSQWFWLDVPEHMDGRHESGNERNARPQYENSILPINQGYLLLHALQNQWQRECKRGAPRWRSLENQSEQCHHFLARELANPHKLICENCFTNHGQMSIGKWWQGQVLRPSAVRQ